MAMESKLHIARKQRNIDVKYISNVKGIDGKYEKKNGKTLI